MSEPLTTTEQTAREIHETTPGALPDGSMSGDTPRPRCVQLIGDTHAAGAENQARYLTAALHQGTAFDVELAYFDPGHGHAQFEAIGAPLRRIARRHRLRYDLFLRTRRLRRTYASHPPDIVQTWLAEANVLGLLAARAWPRTGVVISQRGSWNELDYRLHMRLQRLFIGRADHAISNSDGGAELLERLGMPGERISVVPNGIPLERVEISEPRDALRARMGWSDREVVAWVGRAVDPRAMVQKDFGTLLNAVARLHERRPATLLALIGLTAAEARACGFELPEWAQPLGRTDRAPDFLNAADLLAISSRAEGHSNAAGEALLLGLPVVTTACGGHCDTVEKAGGRITPVGDPTELAKGMAALLENPPGRNVVRDAAVDELSVDRMVKQTTSIYEEVMDRKRSARGAGR